MRIGYAVALATSLGLGVLGCEDGPRKSELNQSCTVTDDCTGKLVCVDAVCVEEGDSPTRLAAESESCATSSQCQAELACLEGTCRAVEVQRVGGLGESCTARNDCAEGHVCLGGRCLKEQLPIEPNAKQCEFVQCQRNADCCGPLSATCVQYQEDCDAGDDFACDNFFFACRCRLLCAEEQCVSIGICRDDLDCALGQQCMGGRCRQCEADADCEGEDQVCENEVCVRGCRSHDDCAALSDCDNGRCVDRGCKSDRECVFFVASRFGSTAQAVAGLATCNDGQCLVPCENDAECVAFLGATMACNDDGHCVNIGCTNSEQCRSANAVDDLFPPYESWVCR